MKAFLNFTLSILAIIILFVSNCNGNKVRTCNYCEGINCLRTSLNNTQQCMDSLDYCVTIFNNFNVIHKGCSLDVPIELRKRCDANTAECHKCNTDRCNNLGQVNFLCLQCDSSKDTNCLSNPSAIAATRCNAPTALNSYCYVKYENGITERGCATTVTEQQKCYADGNCLLCLPSDVRGCNNVDFTAGTRAMQF